MIFDIFINILEEDRSSTYHRDNMALSIITARVSDVDKTNLMTHP